LSRLPSIVARVLVGVLFMTAGAAGLRAEEPAHRDVAAPLAEGRVLFEAKGCAGCHAVWGDKTGQPDAPDLGREGSWRDIMQLAGSLWNHAPAMLEQQRTRHLAPAALSAEEMNTLTAYLIYVRFLDVPGSVERGRELFAQRSCAECHQLGGRGGSVGPRLDELKGYASSFFLAQALWNHGPEMTAKMAALKIPRPSLEDADVADLVAYIRGESRTGTALEMAYAQAGSRQTGQALFREKGCVKCHAIGGEGGRIGPDLGTRRPPRRVAEVAGALWNHGPTMWAKMQEVGVPFPKLTDREMADLLAYLDYVQYTDGPGDATRGSTLFRAKACSQCHASGMAAGGMAAGGTAAKGVEPKIGPDLAASPALHSSVHWAAAMWNHAPAMVHTAHETHLPWLRFEDDEMADLAAFLRSRGGSK